jgi:hypothetical protein
MIKEFKNSLEDKEVKAIEDVLTQKVSLLDQLNK